MKRGLKRKKDKPLSNWILRAVEKTRMTQDQAELLISVSMESLNEGIQIGEEISKINRKKDQ